MDALVLLGSLLVLIALGVPVAYALGLASLVGALWIDIPLDAVMLKISDGVDNFSLLAIPFFVLAGAIMAEGGMAQRMVAFAYIFVGFIRGGLALVNILASTFFGAISGSSVADTASIDLRGAGNALSGILSMQSASVTVATQSAIDDITGTGITIEERDARLAQNDGIVSDDGYLRACIHAAGTLLKSGLMTDLLALLFPRDRIDGLARRLTGLDHVGFVLPPLPRTASAPPVAARRGPAVNVGDRR